LTQSWIARAIQLARTAPISVGALVVVNLVPLVGVLFLDWSVATVLVAYWLENGVVGLLNVPKIVVAGSDDWRKPRNGSSVGLALFFVFHYGLFWLVHGVFVFVLTSVALFTSPSPAVHAKDVLFIAFLLLVSHGTSFFVNYIGRGEYRRTTPSAQMFQPYGRLFVLHLTIVFGAFLVMFLGQPTALVALLVLFKTVFDLGLHLRERARAAAPAVIA
jgi:hypothetical protein